MTKPDRSTPASFDDDLNRLAIALYERGPDRPDRHVPQLRRLAHGLADAVPEDDLPALIAALRAEDARRRETRYERTLGLARAAVALGDLAAARQQAEALCRLDALRWESHRLLGEILERAGDLAGARAQYGTALHLGWEGPEAVSALARAAGEDGNRRRRFG